MSGKLKIKDVSFTVFDVETTGLYPYSGDRICEIAAVRIDPGKRTPKTLHSLVDPQRPISYGASLVNKITDEMVAGKPTIDEILPFFLKFIKGSALVAYNAGFDIGFIEYALGRDKDLLKDYYVIDALRLARRLFPGIGRYNLGNVARTLNISAEGEHRALSDVKMTLAVFKKELKIMDKEGITLIDDIVFVKTNKAPFARKVKDYKTRLIEKAIREEKSLNITYRSAWTNSVTERIITPKEIRSGYDRSYVIAHCHMKNEERNFRMDCILNADVIEYDGIQIKSEV
ncbi:MAG: exonuclease domain-containing protein [Candidatus Omnitrophota bacterium]|nr:exonuclease domain-containing protein [Candidatus Omnitrophota bacterium]